MHYGNDFDSMGLGWLDFHFTQRILHARTYVIAKNHTPLFWELRRWSIKISYAGFLSFSAHKWRTLSIQTISCR